MILSQHLKLLFKLIIQLVLLHNQFMWNGRYAFVKNNEKGGGDILSNHGNLRYFRFVCIPQALIDVLPFIDVVVKEHRYNFECYF